MTTSSNDAVVPNSKEFVAYEDDVAYAMMELWEIDHGDATGVLWCNKELVTKGWEDNVDPNEVVAQIDQKNETQNEEAKVDQPKLTIRIQNDTCREQIHTHESLRTYPCKVFHSPGVEALTNDEKCAIYETVGRFNDFTLDNDSHLEHDFGAFDFKGEKLFWKIDYYTHDLLEGSDDPSDPSKTMRVLNIMLAGEY